MLWIEAAAIEARARDGLIRNGLRLILILVEGEGRAWLATSISIETGGQAGKVKAMRL